MLPENSYRYTSSFPIWIPLIYCSCIIALSRSSDTVLSKNGKNRHPYLVTNLKGKVLTLKN